jgi:oxalate decarboxylase/phosphoglucose isomerase-like protein (cupin superfamily)
VHPGCRPRVLQNPIPEGESTAMTAPSAAPEPKNFLLDPYKDWASGEGVPIHLDFGHDLISLETGPWARYDARGCFAHTHGAGDFMTNYVIEVPPGKKTRPVKHLYEAFFYALVGHGSTTVWLPNGETRSFEWGPKALFAIPLNCQYQIFNNSGLEPVRLSCTSDAPLTINLYHNLDFVFDNPFTFPDRAGQSKHFEGEGDHRTYDVASKSSVRNVWETNFVHDLTSFKLYELEARGKGSLNVSFVLADGTMHSHVSQIPMGRYKKAHRHAAGTHVHAVDGEGYSLLWYEGDCEFKEFPWRHGFMYTPPFWMFHQHFNTCDKPARYVACSLGSRRYPFISLRRKSSEGGGSVSVQQGGRQIEYEDQDPRIHRKWLDAIAKMGVASQMGDTFDEPAIMALPESAMAGVIQTPKSIGPAI